MIKNIIKTNIITNIDNEFHVTLPKCSKILKIVLVELSGWAKSNIPNSYEFDIFIEKSGYPKDIDLEYGKYYDRTLNYKVFLMNEDIDDHYTWVDSFKPKHLNYYIHLYNYDR